MRDGETRAVVGSIAAQLVLIGALVSAFAIVDDQSQNQTDPLKTMEISVLNDTSVAPRPSAQIAAPKTKAPEETPKREEAVDQSEKVAKDTSVEDRPATGAPSTPGGLIWTPPVPVPNAALPIDKLPDEGKRVVLPVVEMKKGAADPQLVSYDQGRFTDAASVHAASQLSGAGSIVMNVSVNATGDVTSCVTQVSSGSGLLDQKGCDLIRSYKYRPAQDANGRPVAAIVSEVLEWARDGKFSDAPSSAIAGVVKAMPKATNQSTAQAPMRIVTMPAAGSTPPGATPHK